MRRTVAQTRARLADRNHATVEINTMISALHTDLAECRPSDPILHEAVGNVAHDLGDLVIEALKIPRL